MDSQQQIVNAPQRTMPKYELLKDHILTEMKAGRLQPGDALPSELEMAAEMNMARNTVRQAMEILDRDGFISRIRGKGTFIHKNAHRQLTRNQGLYALVMGDSNVGHYPELQQGFERAAAETHTQTIVSTTRNNVAQQGNVILSLIAQEVAGVAIEPVENPPFTPPFQIEALQKQGIPVVFYHRSVTGVQAPLVSIPFLEVGRMAGRELLKQGHRRIAMFYFASSHTITPSPSCTDYYTGLREVLREAGGDLPENMILTGSDDTTNINRQEREAWPKIKEMFSRPDRPTAIMTSYDTMGEIVYLALQRLGLRVPEDVSVISFGGKMRQGATVNRLTSVAVDGAGIGRQVNCLLNEMSSGERSIYDTEEIQIPLELSHGQSLGPVPRE